MIPEQEDSSQANLPAEPNLPAHFQTRPDKGPTQTPDSGQQPIVKARRSFQLTTPNPSPFPPPTSNPTIVPVKSDVPTPVEAKILSSTLSQLSLEEHSVGEKRTREEIRERSRKRHSLDGSPSLSPPPFRRTAISSDAFEGALEEIRLAYCGQTIELCGIELLMKSVYFPKIYKLFEAIFKRFIDFGKIHAFHEKLDTAKLDGLPAVR